MSPNQTPEQEARDNIDLQLAKCGWYIQDRQRIDLSVGIGVAVREYPTSTGPADYVLFVNQTPVGVIEAKKEQEAARLSVHEAQVEDYANAQLKYIDSEPLPFLYLSTGVVTKFSDTRDPRPRYREVFTFHRPETLAKWYRQDQSLRARMSSQIPPLDKSGLRDCQIDAITNLETSFKDGKPRALVQMATGSGKTFTAITSVYRLLKHVKAERILFLVDTRNLGEQAEGEFKKYEPQDDNRLFPELYGVHRMTSSSIPQDSLVYISTIQRLYSILKGHELDESAEDLNPNENQSFSKEPMPVVYNERLPIEFFDFIVIDECHRSIYNLWRQVLDYFDAFQVGLTATPDNRTFGYFNQNVVSDYGYEKAVVDGVLVPYNVYRIETQITKDGTVIKMGETVDVRERLTRRKFWETVDEDIEYLGKQLDRDVVNPSTIRLIIREVKNQLPRMFSDRYSSSGEFEVPKMLIFAKTDSHAEDIIDIVRDEFAQGSDFCKKITYQVKDPKEVLTSFRNSYYPRIAVTVDMIATGTDIRPLEVLLFMRDVKSKSYYEQMKGRGTRTCSVEELKNTGTPSAKYSKDHFVIIDAIGVEQSLKTDSRPLEKAPSVPLHELLNRVAVGDRSEETMSTLANRLLKLSKQISDFELSQFQKLSGGKSVNEVVRQLLYAHDPDTKESIIESVNQQHRGTTTAEINELIGNQLSAVLNSAAAPFNKPEFREFLIDVRKKYDQIIDTVNIDTLVSSGWVKDQLEDAQLLVDEFTHWMEAHKDEISALQIYYNQPQRRKDVTFEMIKELSELILRNKPNLAPMRVWNAYEQLEGAQGKPKDELIALVSLIRKVTKLDSTLVSFDKTVNDRFAKWVWEKQQGASIKFNTSQMEWLHMMKDHIAASVHLSSDDLDFTPFDSVGGRGRMYQLFGSEMETIIEELNEALVA